MQPHSCSILDFNNFSKLTFDSSQKHTRLYLWFSPLYPNTSASCSSHYLLCSSHWLRCRRVSLLHELQMMWKRWMMRLQKNNQGDRNRKLFIQGKEKLSEVLFTHVWLRGVMTLKWQRMLWWPQPSADSVDRIMTITGLTFAGAAVTAGPFFKLENPQIWATLINITFLFNYQPHLLQIQLEKHNVL